MKVFIINMAKDVRRKQDMQKQFNKLAVEVEFFEGIDGKTIRKSHFLDIADVKRLEEKEKRPIGELKGMVGCTYSHYLIYEKILKDNIDVACVLEDDVIIAESFNEYLNYIEQNIKQNEIISLHTLLFDPVEFLTEGRAHGECEIMRPAPAKIRGTQGYVITRYCAQQLMSEMMPIKEFPDCFNRYQLFCPDVQIRVLFPFIIRHMWIESVRDDQVTTLKKYVFKFIQKNRIFPFWNLIRTRRRKINDRYISSFIKNDKPLYINNIQGIKLFSDL